MANPRRRLDRNVFSPAGNLAADRMVVAAEFRRRRRFFVLFLSILAGLLFGLYERAHEMPQYEATGLMRIVVNTEGYTGFSRSRKREINADVDLITSERFLLPVIEDLRRSGHDLRHLGSGRKSKSGKATVARDVLVKQLQKALKVDRPVGTELVQITFDGPDPALAADVVNDIMDRAALMDPQMELVRANAIERFLADRMQNLQQGVIAQEHAQDQTEFGLLLAPPQETKTSAPLKSGSPLFPDEAEDEEGFFWKRQGSEALAAENKRLAQINAALDRPTPRSSLTTGVAAATHSRQQAETLATLPKSTLLQRSEDTSQIQTELAGLKDQLALLSTALGPEHPRIKNLSRQISEVEAALRADAATQSQRPKLALDLARAGEHALQGASAAENANARRIWEAQLRGSTRQIEIQLESDLYTVIRQRIAEQRVNAGFGFFAIIVVAQALPPLDPIPSHFLANVGGFSYGVPLGLLLVLALLMAERRLLTVEQLRALGLEVLSIVPKIPHNPQPPHSRPEAVLASLSLSGNAFADELQHLGQSIDLVGASGPKCLLFTSPASAQGKTLIAAHLAASLAHTGARVLLIDANLRQPAVSLSAQPAARPGLSHVLSGSAALADAIHPIPGIRNLDLLPAGPISAQPYELIASQLMKNLLRTARETYTYILIDTPDAIRSPETFVLGSFSDLVFIVAKQNELSIKQLRIHSSRLHRSGAAFVGTIINSV